MERGQAERERRLSKEGEFRGDSVSKPLAIGHRVNRCCTFILHEMRTEVKERKADPSQCACNVDNGMATI